MPGSTENKIMLAMKKKKNDTGMISSINNQQKEPRRERYSLGNSLTGVSHSAAPFLNITEEKYFNYFS